MKALGLLGVIGIVAVFAGSISAWWLILAIPLVLIADGLD